MPKLIDYSDRFDGIREAVYALTLEHGVHAITLDAVAERLYMSPRTIRRLIASVDALPLLGTQWAERRARYRYLRRADSGSWSSRAKCEQALELLLEQMPGHPGAEDRRAWWQLVLAHVATHEWARTARAEQEAVLVTLSEETLTAIVRDDERAIEARRLHFLVSGAIAQICLGTVSHDEAATIVRLHVADVLARHLAGDDAA